MSGLEKIEESERLSITADFWYVLRVHMNSEEQVRNALELRLDSNLYEPFVPIKLYPFRLKKSDGSRGVMPREQICFPGYVFIRSFEKSENLVELKIQEERERRIHIDFLKDVSSVVEKIKRTHYFAHYGIDRYDIAMRPHERGLLDRLMDKSHQIGISDGFIEGDSITVVDGPMVGLEGLIIRLDRHKQTAIIKADFMGDLREITLMLKLAVKSQP